MKRKIWPLIFFAVLIGVFVFIQSPSINKQALVARETAKVLWVVDGDTLKVLLNNKEETVRLIGMDTPETLDERKPVQCFGKEASDKTKEILKGKTITLESDSAQQERDKYGRLLRYVFLSNLNFNKFMISEGYAREYTFKSKGYRYQSEFIRVEEKAKEENKGLWGLCRN